MYRDSDSFCAALVPWIMMSLLFAGTLFVNIILGVLIGALAGWFFSFTSFGTWIAEGLNMAGIKATSDELYKIGAAAGFLTGFLKFSFKPKMVTTQNTKGRSNYESRN